jgi:hypothetical protein
MLSISKINFSEGYVLKQTNRKNEKTTLSIRIIAGAYLLYIVYSLVTDWNQVKPDQKYFIGGAIIIFAILGTSLCISSALGLYRLNRMQDHPEEADTPSITDQDESIPKTGSEEDNPEEHSKETEN